MDSLVSLFDLNMNTIAVNIVLGFLILSAYNITTYEKILSNGITTVFTSFIVGYFYRYIVSYIPISLGFILDYIGIVISGICCGYIFARLIQSNLAESVLDKLKIHRTTNNAFWTNIIDMKYTTKVKVVMQNNLVYTGYLGVTEAYTKTPIITMFGYTVSRFDDGTIVEDYSNTANRLIVLDTRKALSIEMIYGADSAIWKDWANFLTQINDKSYRNISSEEGNIVSDVDENQDNTQC